jgi:hypothetical protein
MRLLLAEVSFLTFKNEKYYTPVLPFCEAAGRHRFALPLLGANLAGWPAFRVFCECGGISGLARYDMRPSRVKCSWRASWCSLGASGEVNVIIPESGTRTRIFIRIHCLKEQARIVLGIGLVANAGSSEPAKGAALRLLLSELQPGSLSAEHYCMLVFDDRHFHAERAHRQRGKDQERKVYEGQLSDTDWNALITILDTKQFRELRVPPSVPALVVHELHPYTVSVARQNGFQNMEFLTKESLKPYESEVKPLLQWWKSSRSAHMLESNAPVDSRCALNDADAIFNN